MDIYKYPYSADIDKFVLIAILENDKVLIYSLTTKTSLKFKILLGSMFEHCEIIDSNIIITHEELIEELVAFKLMMRQNILRQTDKYYQQLLELCEKYLIIDNEIIV